MPRVNMWEAMPGTADEGGGGKDERIDDLEAKEKKNFLSLSQVH